MLAINQTSAIRKVTPNVLPCSIKYNGPIEAEKRYWSPEHSSINNGSRTAYFRGRKLRGRTAKVPDGYQGVTLQKTDRLLPERAPTAEQLRRMEEEEEDEEMEIEKPAEVKTMEQVAKFDEIVVWGHELVPEEDDVYVKGVQEWIAFAEAMHSYEDAPPSSESLKDKGLIACGTES